jgi:hypothetical protein
MCRGLFHDIMRTTACSRALLAATSSTLVSAAVLLAIDYGTIVKDPIPLYVILSVAFIVIFACVYQQQLGGESGMKTLEQPIVVTPHPPDLEVSLLKHPQDGRGPEASGPPGEGRQTQRN